MGEPVKRCVILGAAPAVNMEKWPQLRPEDYLICADGGLEAAQKAGLRVDYVIGDFDSLPDPSQARAYPGEILPVEKDETDTFAAVRHGLARGFREFLLLGGLGGRFDHTFANISTLYYLQKQGARGKLADEDHEIHVLTCGTVRFADCAGCGLGVFPFGAPYCVVNGGGLKYPLDRLKLVAEYPMGVSNTIDAPDAWVEVVEGPALIVLEKQEPKNAACI